MKKITLLLIALLGLCISNGKAQFIALVNFTGTSGSEPGGYPYYDSLVISGNVAYGMTFQGGANNLGCIFSVNTNGSNYRILHNFTGSSSDGAYPLGTLTLSGNTLYGMTNSGGSNDSGIIFSMDSNGSSFTNLHNFTGNFSDGAYPRGSLTLSGNRLFGTTYYGGSSNDGIIFSIDTNGSSFTNLHNFTGGSDGELSYGSLTLSGNTLYGMTYGGGPSNDGIIFSIDTNGISFTDLHNFTGVSSDGSSPYGSLTLSGNTLYGMTNYGGSNNDGIIFSIDTNGSSFTSLHNFTGSSSDGAFPYGSLTLTGTVLYGMTWEGGSNGVGIVFSINTNGSSFTNQHNFIGYPTDGEETYGSLTLSGNNLYGMTWMGGSGEGIIFSYKPITTRVSAISNSSKIAVFPNPSSGIFTFQSSVVSGHPDSYRELVEVFDVLGEKVYSSFTIHNSTFNIDLRSKSNGVYFYRVISSYGEEIGNGKMVIDK